MVRAALAPSASALCLRFSAELVKAAAAALILGAILSATEQHTDFSAQQGFQCIPASDLPAADILTFARGLQTNPVELSRAQLSCLARLLAAKNLTADFGSYPPDLLLFLDLAKVPGGTCEEFYTRASRGNLDLLPRGSARRTGLLRGALACLGVRSSRLHPQQLSTLGALVCDMEPETITASDPGILENLKLCPALTGTQRDALNAVLLRGGTVYGDPRSWDLQTLQHLGPLVLALNQTTLGLVPEAARGAFGRSIAAAYGSQGRAQREKSLSLLRAFAGPSASSRPRLKRSTDRCPSVPITASIISDFFLFTLYDNSEQFELCLSNEVLKANLELLVNQPLTTEFFLVVKKKLEQIYPLGIPEEQLKLLGPLSRMYTAKEISSWLVTSSDTLAALLKPEDGKWEAPQVQQLLSGYLALGGTLTSPLLREMGGENLCNLQEEQIEQIPPEAIRTAGQVNISSCSQPKKDQLYRKAREAFAGQAGTIRAYYCRIWPYLGGAPVNDLKDLAGAGVAIDMDMDTFLALNPKELLKLSVLDVKRLLGDNLPSLKEAEDETLVMCWVKRQSQWELDCILGIDLRGGMVEPGPAGTATSPPCPTASTSTIPTATVPAPTTLPPVPTPVDGGSHSTTHSSTSSAKVPTPSKSTTPPPDTATTSAAVTPVATSTTRPAPTATPVAPCSTHQPATSSKATPPAVTLLTTILAPVNRNATSPSSIAPPALTREATTSGVTTPNASTPLVSTGPPAPGGTTHPAPATHNAITPSTHNTPGTLVPNSTSAPTTTATKMSLPSPQPTPISNSTISTQKSVGSSTAKTTRLPCKTGTPPAFLGLSSTASSIETTKETHQRVPESPRPTHNGYINLQPEPGSSPRPSPCLLPLLATAVGISLLRALL